MSNEPKEPRKRHSFTWLFTIVLVFVFVIYPLSIGPVNVLFHRGILPKEFVGNVYEPLNWFTAHTGTDQLIDSYVRFWLEMTNTRMKDTPRITSYSDD